MCRFSQLLIISAAMNFAAALPAFAQNPAATACVLKAAEISAVMGVKFSEGVPGLETKSGATVSRSCRYTAKDYALNVKAITYGSAADAKYDTKPLAGSLEAVAGDADGAVHQVGQGDATSPNVRYARGTTFVELRVLGTYYKDLKTKPADLAAVQAKLLKLKRFP